MLSKIPSFTVINATWYFQMKFRIATWIVQHLVTRSFSSDLVPKKLLLYLKHDLNETSLCQMLWKDISWWPSVKQFLSFLPRSLFLCMNFFSDFFSPPFTFPYLSPLSLFVLYFELNCPCQGVGAEEGCKKVRGQRPLEEINFLPWNLRSLHFSPFTNQPEFFVNSRSWLIRGRGPNSCNISTCLPAKKLTLFCLSCGLG